MDKRIIAVLLMAALVIPFAFAAEEGEGEEGDAGVFASFKTQIEVFNMIASVFIFVMSLIAYSSLDKELKKSWIFISAGLFLFAIYELLGGLADFGVVSLPGARVLVEILFVVVMAAGMVKFMMRPASYA